jgi:transcription elongation factor Elf1
MNQTAGRKNKKAVVCLFCGLLTPVPENRLADDARVSIIRCRRCGKEAPYPANRITDGQDVPNIRTPKVRVVGLN